MSEEIKSVKFDAGFEHAKDEKTPGVMNVKYKDENSFTANSPLTKTQLADQSKYENQYGKDFLKASVEESKKIFSKEKSIDVVKSEASFGVHKSDKINVMVARGVKQVIRDFKGESPDKEITTCSIKVNVQKHSDLGKTFIKDVKKELHKDIYGEE